MRIVKHGLTSATLILVLTELPARTTCITTLVTVHMDSKENTAINLLIGVLLSRVRMVPIVDRRRTLTIVTVRPDGLAKCAMSRWFLVKMLRSGKVVINFLATLTYNLFLLPYL